MATIKVDTAVLAGQQSTYQGITQQLGDISSRIGKINQRLTWEISSSSQIHNTLVQYSRLVEQFRNQADALQSNLILIVEQYEKAENGSTNCVVPTGTTIARAAGLSASKLFQGINVASSASSPSQWDWKKFGANTLGSFGVIGGATSLLLGKYDNAVDWLKGGKNLSKNAYDLARTWENYHKISRTGCDYRSNMLQRFFGLGKNSGAKAVLRSGRASTASTFGTRLYNNLHNQKGFFEQYNLKKGASAAFKWAGAGLTLASNAVSNFDPKSGNSTGRAIAETITETAVDLVKDWGVGLAVSAGVLAVAPAAPAVAIVAATAVATNAIDYGVKKLTGKSSTELISDCILDTGEKVGKFAINAGKSVVSWGKNLFNSVKSFNQNQAKRGWKSLFA